VVERDGNFAGAWAALRASLVFAAVAYTSASSALARLPGIPTNLVVGRLRAWRTMRRSDIEPAAALVDDVGVCRYVGRSAAATKAIIHQINNAKART